MASGCLAFTRHAQILAHAVELRLRSRLRVQVTDLFVGTRECSVERLVNHGHHRLLLGGLLDGMRHGLGGIGGGHGGKLPG